MEYRAVKNRCAVNINSLQLPISENQAITILTNKGFKIINTNIIAWARSCVGKSLYRRGAKTMEAPGIVDCSSLIKWLYGQCGIWLPRRSIQQLGIGKQVDTNEICAGDVIFISGLINYYHDDPNDGVGHVGIATGEGTVIHAANKKQGIIESSLENFTNGTKLRGVRRYIPKDQNIITLEAPTNREVETADDIRWIILQSLT